MTRAVLADTGPLYAANDEGDAHHQRALRELKQLARDGRQVLVAYPILLETYSLLLYRLGRKATSGWLTEITNATFVNPTPADYTRAFTTVQTLGDQRITLVDATVAALATRMKLEVWSYGHHFDVMRVDVWR